MNANTFLRALYAVGAVSLAACSSTDESSQVSAPGQDAALDSVSEATPGDDAAPADASAEAHEEASADGATEAAADSSAEAGNDGEVPGDDAAQDGPKPQCGAYQAVADWPTSGYLMHFTAASEHAHALVNSTEGMDHIAAWLKNTSENLGIPGGPIELNPQYNPGYSYRLVPEQIKFGDMWIELCDAAPCYIEQDSATWLANPTTWCPWGFSIVDIWDCRTNTSGSACPKVYP